MTMAAIITKQQFRVHIILLCASGIKNYAEVKKMLACEIF